MCQVVALRSQQLKSEQAYSQAEAAEAKLAEAGQQLATLAAQLSTGGYVTFTAYPRLAWGVNFVAFVTGVSHRLRPSADACLG